MKYLKTVLWIAKFVEYFFEGHYAIFQSSESERIEAVDVWIHGEEEMGDGQLTMDKWL